jgi:hypothetical protein
MKERTLETLSLSVVIQVFIGNWLLSRLNCKCLRKPIRSDVTFLLRLYWFLNILIMYF